MNSITVKLIFPSEFDINLRILQTILKVGFNNFAFHGGEKHSKIKYVEWVHAENTFILLENEP